MNTSEKRASYKLEFKLNIRLAYPIMIGQMGQILVSLADNIMVGRLGSTELAAVSLANAVFIPLTVVGMGISFALPPLVAEASGRQNERRVSRYFKHSLVINLVYALLAMAVIEGVIYTAYELRQVPAVVDLAIPYLRISSIGIIPFMIFQTLRCYADGLGQTHPAMYALVIGNIINVIANYMFIYGHWGAPALEVTGAAIGTLISRIVMLGIVLAIILKRKSLAQHVLNADYLEYHSLIFKRILRLGIPSSLQMFFEVSAFGGAAFIMGTLGAAALAAHQIALNLASMTFLICTGLGMAATIRVGNAMGRKDRLAMHRAGISAILQVILFMFISAVAFVIFRNYFPRIYINDNEVLSIASILLIMAAIFQIPDGVQVTALGALRGIQDVIMPSWITFGAYWLIGLPFSYMAATYWDMGPVGVWLGLVLGLTSSAILLFWRFYSKTKPSKV